MFNPYAVYVNCDGAMDYNSENTGGVGFVINFPDFVHLDPIPISIGRYVGGNIERLELEALIQAMKETIDVFEKHSEILKGVMQVIFITDRYHLKEDDKTSAWRISEYRRNKWKNYEGKPIKNHKLLDELDKTRKKLIDKAHVKVNIEWRPRKQNKIADKLAKKGKEDPLSNEKLSKKGEKIGKRKFDGLDIKYKTLVVKDELYIHVFRKDPVQDEWEVWVEICDEKNHGMKLQIYADDILAKRLQRRNEYIIRVKEIFTHHIHIFRTIKKIKK